MTPKQAFIPLAVLALLLLATPADAAWRVETVHSGSSGYNDVALAGNARGDAALAFELRNGIGLAIAHRGRAFGKPRSEPVSAGATAPKVAIDEQGNVLVLWTYFDGFGEEDCESREGPCCEGTLATVRYARGKHYRRVQALTPPGHEITAEAYAIRRGRAGVVWSEGSRIRARFAPRGHGFGGTAELIASGTGLAVSLAHGNRVTYASYGAHATRIGEFRVRGGTALQRRTLARGLPDSAYVTVATNARGEQAAAWQRSDREPTSPVHLAVRSAAGRFHSRVVSHRGAFEDAPVVAIAGSGAAIAAWATTRGTLLVSGRHPGGQFAAASRFDRNGRRTSVDDVELAIGAAGSILGWTQQKRNNGQQFFGAFRSPFGLRSHVRRFGRADYIGTQRSAAIDASGRARLAWRVGSRVKAARAPYP